MKSSDKAFVIICDASGYVKEIICNNFFKDINKIAGIFFMDLVDSKSFIKASSFLKEVKINENIFNYEININFENRMQLFYLDGIKYKDEVLIIAKNKQTEIYDLADRANTEQSNTIRNLLQEPGERLSTLESASLANESCNNISGLNNELINMQREIAIKNYELENLNKKLKDLTITDELTKLFNRRFFYEKVNEEKIRSLRLNYDVVLASIDINNFKVINDNYGHEEGDRLLIGFAELLKKFLRANFDSIYRFGGDEFVVLFVNCSLEKSYEILKKINLKFSEIRKEVSIAYGVVKIEMKKGKNIDQYLKIADDLMFENKRAYKKTMPDRSFQG